MHDMQTQLIVKAKATQLHALSQRNEAMVAQPVDQRGKTTTRNNARQFPTENVILESERSESEQEPFQVPAQQTEIPQSATQINPDMLLPPAPKE